MSTNQNSDGKTIRDSVAPGLAMSTFYDALSRMKITYKKEPKYKSRNEQKRKEFMERIEGLEVSDLVFCDEMGEDDNIAPLYGWSEEGCRAYGEVEGFRKERRSIIAGYTPGTKQLIAPMEYKGFTDTRLFNQWLEDQLCPNLRKGQYVILDNAEFHKSPLTEEIIKRAGFHLLYLPPYSPDLNPIENCWANFKNYLRKIIDQYTSFSQSITVAMKETLLG